MTPRSTLVMLVIDPQTATQLGQALTNYVRGEANRNGLTATPKIHRLLDIYRIAADPRQVMTHVADPPPKSDDDAVPHPHPRCDTTRSPNDSACHHAKCRG